MTYQEKIAAIQKNDVYKQIISESFGGVIYNIANQDKYDTSEILPLWLSLSDAEKNDAGVIMVGAMNFVQGD